MKSNELEDIYNTLDSINDKLNSIKEKSKLKQNDIDIIQGFKNQVEMMLELLAKHLKL